NAWPAVTIGDPDVAVLADHDASGSVEVFFVGAGHPGFAERHDQLAIVAEFVNLMTEVLLESRFPARVAVGRAIRHPDEPLAIDEEAVRKVHDALAETAHELPIHVDFDDRVEGGLGASVGAASIEDPEVLTVGIGPDAAGHADLTAFELVPVVVHLVRRDADLRAHDDA